MISTVTENPCPHCGYPMPAVEPPTACAHCGGEIRSIQSDDVIRPGPKFFLTDFLHGLFAPFQAMLVLLNQKQFIGKLRWPVLANLVVVGLLFAVTVWGIYSGFESLTGTDWGWFDWLRTFGGGTIAFLLTTMTVWTLAPIVIQVVTSPFLDGLAQTTESIITGSPQKPIQKGLLDDLIYSLRQAAKILALQLILLVPILVLALIPLLAFVPILLTAYLNAMVWLETPIVRRRYEFAYRRRILRRNWARCMGFGLGFQVGMFVPFFNVLFLAPAATVAISQLYFRFEKGTAAE